MVATWLLLYGMGVGATVSLTVKQHSSKKSSRGDFGDTSSPREKKDNDNKVKN